MKRYAGYKALVTGGTGFIGGRLAERLCVEEGAEVRVLVHDWRNAVWVSRADVELVQGDVTDSESVAQAIEGCDIIFHCVGVGGSYEQCMRVNLDGTQNILNNAIKANIKRIIYLSTIAVHGPNPPNDVNERDEFRRIGTPYGDSKIAAEELIWSFWKEKHIPITVIRPTFIWGPRSSYFTVWPVRLMKDNQWFLVDGGRGTCHANYVDNLVDAILLAGIEEKAIGEAFLVTGDQPCTWSEFFGYYARMNKKNELPSVYSNSYKTQVDRISRVPLKILGNISKILRHTPTFEPARTLTRGMRFGLKILRRPFIKCLLPFDSWDMLKYARIGGLDTSKIKTLLGYRPRVSLEQGMKETMIWLRDQRII